MATNYPASKDDGTSLPTPAAGDKTNSPSHSSMHGNENAAIIAIENKLGTGASTPASNTIMFGTGSGTSAWTQLTSAQLLSSITDETGTGSLVFANTPTLVTPKVDTINESTPSNGVTVGGVNLKSGVVGANAVATASIADAAVTPAKLLAGTGTSWAWQSWTPTWTNLTVGNGTVAAFYNQTGKTVHCTIAFTMGSTSVMGSNPTATYPVTAAARFTANIMLGTLYLEDAGVAGYLGFIQTRGTTTFGFNQPGAAGTYLTNGSVTAAIPFAWGTGDFFSGSFIYEAA